MRSLLSSLLQPLLLFWILVVLAVYFDFSWRKRLATKAILGGFFLLFIITTPFVPNFLVKNLENRYPVFSVKQIKKDNRPIHILVLGGGHTYDERLPANNQLSSGALVRLTEGIRLNRVISGSELITSGYGGDEEITQAEVLANSAVLLGVNPSVIKMQNSPVNTWMEATEYKRLNGDSAQLIVVTSAIHMPRAIYLFRKAGLDPIAAPTNHILKYGKSSTVFNWLPSAQYISKTDAAIHEYVGLLWGAIAYP